MRRFGSSAGGRVQRLSATMSPLAAQRLMSTAATATYDQSVNSFPSIVIGPNRSITPQGTFAEAQAEVRERLSVKGLHFIMERLICYDMI